MALLLARRGHRVVLVEKKAGPCEHPAAHMLHSRTLEILEEIDPALIAEAISRGASIDEVEEVLWCTSLTGTPLGRCSALPEEAEERDRYHAHSAQRALHLPQHRLEPILYEWIEREPNIEFLLGVEWLGYEEAGECVISALRRTDGSTLTRESRFLIGADGASSAVRQAAKIEMEGPAFEYLISVFFEAKFKKPRRGILYWVINPSLIGVLIHHLGDDWVLMIPYHPPVERPEDLSDADYIRYIRAAFGVPDLEPRIKVARSWVMSSAIAARYRKGQVFLVGDAAHRFPPTGGFGANTGIQDAHNLAWKLDAYLRGHAGDSLLETYEVERRPIAIVNAEQSRVNHEMTAEMTRALGLDPGAIKRLMSAGFYRILPRMIKRALLRGGQKLALRSLALLSKDGPAADALRARLSEAIELQRDHFLTRGQELGFHYQEGFVIPSNSPKPKLGDGIREYLPTSYPGARFPHFMIEYAGERRSSHALLKRNGLTLFASERFRAAIEAFVEAAPSTLPIGAAVWGESSSRILDDEVFAQLDLGEDDALLIRPDAHIAARLRGAEAAGGIVGALEAALRDLGILLTEEIMQRT